MSGLTRREIEAVKEDILSAFHCALPGIVEVFRPETRTADIRPAVRGRHKEELPLLRCLGHFLKRLQFVSVLFKISREFVPDENDFGDTVRRQRRLHPSN